MLKRLSYLFILISFSVFLIFGFLFSLLFEHVVSGAYDIAKFMQVLVMAFCLSGGGLLGFRMRSKGILRFLESGDLTFTSPYGINRIVSIACANFDDVLVLVQASDMPITYLDRERKVLKFREKFKIEKGSFQVVGFAISCQEDGVNVFSAPIYKDNMEHLAQVSEAVYQLISVLENKA